MADKNDSGDKTEKPTPKKLKDARKKGDVSKSKDVSSTVVMILWIVLLGTALLSVTDLLAGLLNQTLMSVGQNQDFFYTLQHLGKASFSTFMKLTVILIVPVVLVGLLVEFLQAGPVITMEADEYAGC